MIVEIRVDSSLRVLASQVGPIVGAQLEAAFTHENPEHARLVRINRRAAWKESPRIRTYSIERDGGGEWLTMPRGGAGKVRAVLRAAGMEWRFVDLRTEGAEALRGRIPEHWPLGVGIPGELWPHQGEIVEALVRRENCLVRAPTGSGKTTAAIAAIARLQLPALVVVWNSALLEQWIRRLQKELGLTRIGVVQGSRFSLEPVTIAMQQTIWRLAGERLRALDATFGVVVCDEVQRFAARTFRDVVRKFGAKYRLGISADETRKDRKEFLIYDEFGSIEAEVDQRRLVDLGVVHEVEVRVVPTDFRADWYKEQRKAAAIAVQSGSMTKPPEYKRLIDELTANAERNAQAMALALAEQRAGHQVVILSERVDHCRQFSLLAAAEGVPSGIMAGDVDGERESTIARLMDGSLRFAAGTVGSIGQGLDIPAVGRGVVATPLAATRQLWGQVRGRFCRTQAGKLDAVLFYLWDRHVFGAKHLRNLKAWNRRALVWHEQRWIPAAAYLKEVLGNED